MGKAIIVTGTPGTGKTTVAMGLAREIRADYISLNQFAANNKLYSGVDRIRRSKIIDVAKTRKKLQSHLIHNECPTVVDTHMPDGLVNKEYAQRVFVLRCHPRILEARLRRKKWKAGKIRENVLAEILDSCLSAAVNYYGRRKVAEFDTSRTTVKQCVSSLKKTLGKSFKRKIAVDWLAQLEKEGTLERYLK